MFYVTDKGIKPNAELVQRHVNRDLCNIVTPVKVEQLEGLLHESHYDGKEIDFLVRGFKSGFDLNYQGLW